MLIKFKQYPEITLCLFISCIIILSITLYGAIDLTNQSLSDCTTTNATIIQYDINDFIPPIEHYKWFNISYVYELQNTSYYHNIVTGKTGNYRQKYYQSYYSPIGRIIKIVYTLSNVSNTWYPADCHDQSANLWGIFLFIVACCSLIFIIFIIGIFCYKKNITKQVDYIY